MNPDKLQRTRTKAMRCDTMRSRNCSGGRVSALWTATRLALHRRDAASVHGRRRSGPHHLQFLAALAAVAPFRPGAALSPDARPDALVCTSSTMPSPSGRRRGHLFASSLASNVKRLASCSLPATSWSAGPGQHGGTDLSLLGMPGHASLPL